MTFVVTFAVTLVMTLVVTFGRRRPGTRGRGALDSQGFAAAALNNRVALARTTP